MEHRKQERDRHNGTQLSLSAFSQSVHGAPAAAGKLKDTGLTLGQPKVLDYLQDHDGANQAEIARACHIEPASLTSVLNRMEEKALVERRT